MISIVLLPSLTHHEYYLTDLQITRFLWWLSHLYSGLCSKMVMLIPVNLALSHGLLVCFGIQQLHFLGYLLCTLEFSLQCYACGQKLVYFS